jgi:hypothetical protein
MRPKRQETTGSSDLFRARLDQIINMKHELAQLAGKCRYDLMTNQPPNALNTSSGISEEGSLLDPNDFNCTPPDFAGSCRPGAFK